MSQLHCISKRKSGQHLTYEDRKVLEYLYNQNLKRSRKERLNQKALAKQLGFSEATLSRELRRGLVEQQTSQLETYMAYSSVVAQSNIEKNWENKGRDLKIGKDHKLCRQLEKMLLGEEVKELGVKYQWMAPDKKDTALQIEILNNAIASSPDALIVAAVDPNAIVDTLKKADEAGIKIFYADSRAEYDAIAAFATDNFAAGKVAGEQMIQGLKEKGIEEGDIGIVAFSSATQTSVDREGGFREAFEGTNYNLLETQYGDSEVAASQAAAENFITQNVVGVYGNNEPGAVGVGNASAANKSWEGVAVGFDASQVTLDQVEQGALYCVIAQNPKEMGNKAVSAAVKVINGEELAEKIVDTGSSVVTKDNIDDFR